MAAHKLPTALVPWSRKHFSTHVSASAAPALTFISSNVAKLGYHPSELISSPDLYRGLIHQDDRGHVEEVLGQLSKGCSVEPTQFRMHTKEGIYRWFENRVTPVWDSDGRILGAEGMLIGIAVGGD